MAVEDRPQATGAVQASGAPARGIGGAVVRAPLRLPASACKGTWVVIAAYDEEVMVGPVVREVRRTFPNVVVVDDGSRDRTAARARGAGAEVLRHAINRGQGAALQTGILHALRRGADILVTFDADGQHDAGDLPYLVSPIVYGEADFVLGSRFLGTPPDSLPWLRRWLLRAGVWFTWLASGLRLSDAHNGMRAFSRRAAEGLDLRLDRMAHASELIDCVQRSGLPYCEVPVRVRYTPYSRAKGQRSGDALKIAFDYLLDRWLR